MPDPTNTHARDIPISDAISRPLKADLPTLVKFESVTYSFTPDDAPLPSGEVSSPPPELPAPRKVETFYDKSLPHLNVPSKAPVQTEMLILDEPPSLITPKNSKHTAQILVTALNFWRSIDSRAFETSPDYKIPFKELGAQAQAASELLKRTKVILSVVKAHFSGDPQQILKTFTESVVHYRGVLRARPVQEACRMAAYEMVQDAGVVPHIPRPEISSQTTQPEEPKQKKTINYGRPDTDSSLSNTQRVDDRSDTEIKRERLQASRLEAETAQRKEEQREFIDLKNEIRKPLRPNERYGKFTPSAAAENSLRKLDALPDWIKFAMEVSAAENLTSSNTTPPIQGVALEIADWAKNLITYAELHQIELPQSDASNTEFNIAELLKRLDSVIRYHTHCDHILKVAEDLSQQIRALGQYDSLSDQDKKAVDILAPVLTGNTSTQIMASETSSATSPIIRNSWGGEPISSAHASETSDVRHRAEKIRLLALQYLAKPSGSLRFIQDPGTALKVATQMATETVDKPKRPLGE